MKLKLFVLFFLAFINGCIVGPYKSQSYAEIRGSRAIVGENEYHFYIVDGGKYEGDEAVPPYRIGIWLLSNEISFKKITIEEVQVSLNGKKVEGVSFKNIGSKSVVSIPGTVQKINMAPCCGFKLISNELPFEYVEGDRLDVFISLTINSEKKSSASISYKATVKKGLIRWITIV